MKKRFLVILISFLFSVLSVPTSAETVLLEKTDEIEFAQLTKNLKHQKAFAEQKPSCKNYNVKQFLKTYRQVARQEKLYIKIRCLLI